MENFYPKENVVHKKLIGLVLLFTLLVPIKLSSQTNIPLTTNRSSFEVPYIPLSGNVAYWYTPNGAGSDWTFYGQSGLSKNGTVFTWANPPAPRGQQVLFLQNNGYVETTFNFTSTAYYRFLFKGAWREGCCEKPKYIRIKVDGVEVGEVELKSKYYEEYVTLPVHLNSGTHTIRIEGDQPPLGGDFTGFVDDFRIEQIPTLVNYSYMTVQPGTTRVIGTSNYNFTQLLVRGNLVAPVNHDVNITSNFISVESSGRFQIGQERSPYQHEATITLNGANLSQYGEMGTKFLGAMGNGVIELHGKEKVSWTKLRETANAGSSTIKVLDPVDWEVGDEIVIAPSRAPNSSSDVGFANEYDKRTITGISNGNRDITLNTGLSYRHTGQTHLYSGNGQYWHADMRAEVGLLTRNIKIQGDANTVNSGHAMYKKGAHMMIMGSAKAYINGIELYRVGQNKLLGKYPFHWHRRNDADGQYFKNSSVHQSYNRALTIHETNNVLVENSVFFDHIGHGIFFEWGSEEGNEIIGNLVIGTKKPSPSEAMSSHPSDGETINEFQNRGPASYWITHPNNKIEGNVATGTVGTGFWYIFPLYDLGGLGKQPSLAPFGSFKNNVAHSTRNGFDINDGLQTDHSVLRNIGYLSPTEFKIENCTWYANKLGVYTGTGANVYDKDEYLREIYAPDDLLVFDRNIFADNEKSLMLASNNQVKNSIFIADTGFGNAPTSGQSMIFMYDGAGTVSDSHIIGYNSSASHMMKTAGASFTYGNFKFENVTRANSLVFTLPNSDIDSNLSPGALTRRNATIYDKSGSLSGVSGSTLITNFDFVKLGGEVSPPGWTNVLRTSRRYVNTHLRLHLDEQSDYGYFLPLDVIRSKPNTTTVTLTDYRSSLAPTLPFIVNDPDLLYTFDLTPGGQALNLPATHKIIQFKMAVPAEQNDFVIVKFTDIGSQLGLFVDMSSDEMVHWGVPNQSVTRKYSMTALKNSSYSAYYISGSDLYIKAVSNGHFSQFFNLKWGLMLGGTANNSETLQMQGERTWDEIGATVYPNPASSKLYIKGVLQGEKVGIVDASGRLMETTRYTDHLDISRLKPGMYMIRTEKGNHRFIKQ